MFLVPYIRAILRALYFRFSFRYRCSNFWALIINGLLALKKSMDRVFDRKFSIVLCCQSWGIITKTWLRCTKAGLGCPHIRTITNNVLLYRYLYPYNNFNEPENIGGEIWFPGAVGPLSLLLLKYDWLIMTELSDWHFWPTIMDLRDR